MLSMPHRMSGSGGFSIACGKYRERRRTVLSLTRTNGLQWVMVNEAQPADWRRSGYRGGNREAEGV